MKKPTNLELKIILAISLRTRKDKVGIITMKHLLDIIISDLSEQIEYVKRYEKKGKLKSRIDKIGTQVNEGIKNDDSINRK